MNKKAALLTLDCWDACFSPLEFVHTGRSAGTLPGGDVALTGGVTGAALFPGL